MGSQLVYMGRIYFAQIFRRDLSPQIIDWGRVSEGGSSWYCIDTLQIMAKYKQQSPNLRMPVESYIQLFGE